MNTRTAQQTSHTRQHLVWITPEARELLDREAKRIQRETGGKPSGSFLADRAIKEQYSSK